MASMALELQHTSLAEEVLGITDRTDREAAFAQARHTLGYDDNPAFAEGKPPKGADRDALEADLDFRIVGNILDGGLDEASTLTDWLSYYTMMQLHGTKGNGEAVSLNIGALGAVAARSFACAAEHLYGAGTAHVVDLEAGEAKARHGTFTLGNGLHMSFLPDESVDFVHTNHLFADLKDPSRLMVPDIQLRLDFFREVARVLRSGGQLLMKELVPKHDPKRSPEKTLARSRQFGDFITRSLHQFDISDVRVAQAQLPTSPDFLFDPARNFPAVPTELNQAMITVYARK